MNAYNVSKNTAQPLYNLETEVSGIHLSVQSHSLIEAQRELRAEADRIEEILISGVRYIELPNGRIVTQ